MDQEITLQSLIDKVREDLLEPYTASEKAGKRYVPIFLVDQVELEVTVEIRYDSSMGLKITIPQLVEGSLGKSQAEGSGHKMKLVLSPILTREEIRQGLEDAGLLSQVKEASSMSLRKGVKLEGI